MYLLVKTLCSLSNPTIVEIYVPKTLILIQMRGESDISEVVELDILTAFNCI